MNDIAIHTTTGVLCKYTSKHRYCFFSDDPSSDGGRAPEGVVLLLLFGQEEEEPSPVGLRAGLRDPVQPVGEQVQGLPREEEDAGQGGRAKVPGAHQRVRRCVEFFCLDHAAAALVGIADSAAVAPAAVMPVAASGVVLAPGVVVAIVAVVAIILHSCCQFCCCCYCCGCCC